MIEMSGGEAFEIHCRYGHSLRVSRARELRISFSIEFLKFMTINTGICRILQNIREDYHKDTKYVKPTSLEEMKEIYIVTALNLWLYDHDVDISGTGLDCKQRYIGLDMPKCITFEEYTKVVNMLMVLDRSIGISSLILERHKNWC